MQPETTDLAYLAGVIDAAGYITATASIHKRRRYFGAQVGITGVRREPHDLAASIFGGTISVHQQPDSHAHHKVHYRWQISGKKVLPILIAIRPYLRVKVDQAHLVIALQEQVTDATLRRRALDDPYPHMPAEYDPTPRLLADVDEIRALHGWRGFVGTRTPVSA